MISFHEQCAKRRHHEVLHYQRGCSSHLSSAPRAIGSWLLLLHPLRASVSCQIAQCHRRAAANVPYLSQGISVPSLFGVLAAAVRSPFTALDCMYSCCADQRSKCVCLMWRRTLGTLTNELVPAGSRQAKGDLVSVCSVDPPALTERSTLHLSAPWEVITRLLADSKFAKIVWASRARAGVVIVEFEPVRASYVGGMHLLRHCNFLARFRHPHVRPHASAVLRPHWWDGSDPVFCHPMFKLSSANRCASSMKRVRRSPPVSLTNSSP